MSQWFQSQHIACCAVGGQVRSDLGVVHPGSHYIQASEHPLGVEKVLHPQDVDDGFHVIGCVVESQLTLVGGEELQQQGTNLLIGRKEAMFIGIKLSTSWVWF